MPTILIVDDSVTARGYLACMLDSFGYTVVESEDGRMAFSLLNDTVVDLILLDQNMPGLDGDDVLQELKSLPNYRDIPVIMVSDMDDIDNVARCIELGAEDYLPKPVSEILLKARVSASLEKKRLADQQRIYLEQLDVEKKRTESLLNLVIPIGVALSAETDFDRLLESIVTKSMELCNADAGTFYLRTPDDRLNFVVAKVLSLDLAMGVATNKTTVFPPLDIYVNGKPNHKSVAAWVAGSGRPLNIPNVYENRDFDFSVTREYDKRRNYRSVSMLAVPLKNKVDHVVGVLQFINARDGAAADRWIPFEESIQQLIEVLSSLAAASLEAYVREQGLRQEIHELRIEIDELKRDREVQEIAGSDYFQDLLERADQFRADDS